MSVTQVPLRPLKRGSLLKLWLGLGLLALAAFLLARAGAGSLAPEKTASGLEFRTLQGGSGPLIQKEDAALIEYVGTFDDGKVFDSPPQPVPMTPMATVPGFAEAMMKMQRGGRYKFRLPPELAYGDSPPPGMAPNAALNFEVVVREVAAGMGPAIAQQMQMQQQMQSQGASPGGPEAAPAR